MVLTGGNGDSWIKSYFTGMPIVDTVGKLNLLELIALFDQVDLLVTHDSGPLHLAGLTDVNIIAIFGPTNPLEKVPNRRNVYTVCNSEIYACAPCYDGKYYAHCEQNKCLMSITAKEIMDYINDLNV